MSAASGIQSTPELVSAFSQADSQQARFLKVSIRNEQLVLDSTTPKSGSFTDDLNQLQSLLDDDIPAYILARLDGGEWLAISYVPDTARVRDKMLYAASRAALSKSLGGFTDSLFATSKADLTPDAYTAHRRHMSAASPLSAREAEMERLRAAERAAGDESQGTSGRVSHVGKTVGLAWGDGLKQAAQELAEAQNSKLLIISIDTATETMVLASLVDAEVEDLPKLIPASEPSYAFFAWSHTLGSESRRDIVFIYSCPSSSPVKHRMVYSSGVGVAVNEAKQMGIPVAKRVETSDLDDLDAAFLLASLGLDNATSGTAGSTPAGEPRGFARPKGPARKR
ncbi:actin depolymerizing protein [Exidia glandulosa HHB12029]|uniref:Twinfilin n=1 Tax=Exidia glandulosa HHB12029 TaxID=1314781 RepID=A0A165DFF1_EXIGL|nr:actin depolymerizing protein [Exidia glandulosa HHB12029]